MSTESRYYNEQSAMTIRSLESRLIERENETMVLRTQMQSSQTRDQKDQFLKTREDVKHLREELQEMYDSYRREQQQAIELSKEVKTT
jgi:predicted patatin/cPLA2 family phospholipase